MNGPEGFLPKNQNFTTQVARILWYRPLVLVLMHCRYRNIFNLDVIALCDILLTPARAGTETIKIL